MRPLLKLLDGATATNGKPSDTAATGTIVAAAGNTITTGTYFILDDGMNPPIQFVFDSASAVSVTATRKAIAYTSGDSSATIKAAIISAINGVAAGLRITASAGGGSTVNLTNDFGGTHGNTTLTNNTGLTSTGMTGGTDAGFPLNGHVPGTPYFWIGQDTGVIKVTSIAGSGTMDVTIRVWCHCPFLKQWFPMGSDNTTISNRGMLNDKGAITEDGADILRHAEHIEDLSAFDRIYLEITIIDGTSTSIDAILDSVMYTNKH